MKTRVVGILAMLSVLIGLGFMMKYTARQKVQVDDHIVNFHNWDGSASNFHTGMTTEEILQQPGVFQVSRFDQNPAIEEGYEYRVVYRSQELIDLKERYGRNLKKPTATYVMAVLVRGGYEPWKRQVKVLDF